MNKIRNIKEYIDTVKENSDFFKNYYFHSLIDLNLVKLDSILEYGILSKNLIEHNNLVSIYTHDNRDFDSKNGSGFVSLSEYSDSCYFNMLFESFPLHTLTSISLLVNRNIPTTNKGERETYFFDEVFCPGFVPKDKLEGIILPEHLSNLPINKISCLPNDLYCYTKRYINHWIMCMESYFGQTIRRDDINNSLEQLWNILEEYEMPEKWVQSAIEEQRRRYGKDLKDVLANILQSLWSKKLGITNPNYIDIILKINNDRLPIYEIKRKCLKRII